MAFRKFDTLCWEDPWFEALSRDAKLLFIYLWTNNTCNPAGMYRITKDRIQFNCGVSIEKHAEELKPKVLWHSRESIVWVKNFFRHQRQNPKFSEAAVKSISQLPCTLKAAFYEYNHEILDTDQIPPLPPINRTEEEAEEDISSTVVEPDTNPPSNGNGIKPEKRLYLESVKLTDDEHGKLIQKYGEPLTSKAIEILNNAIQSKGYKYKSHYHTLIGWPMKEAKEQGGGSKWFSQDS